MTRASIILLVSAGLLLSISANAQEAINNTKSDDHKQVIGTGFFLVPPPGFSSATNFQGFQQESSGGSIILTVLPAPFSEISGTLTAEAFLAGGMELQTSEDVKVNGDQGYFITLKQNAYGITFSKYMLVFGDEETIYMVTGSFPLEAEETGKNIRRSMFSVVYEKDLMVDPLASAPFSINTDNTKLKFAQNMSGSFLYTVDGKVPTESNDKTSLFIGMSYSKIQPLNMKATALQRINTLPYDKIDVDESSINKIEIGGISGYEIIGEGLDNTTGESELIYQAMLFSNDDYFIILGTTNNDQEENLDLFKRITNTFRKN
ncbi:MAG: hypothetical protein ED557_10180 [Balneola sp.]|nr:MAG: hypothetical protein ED557_10180 [Balneola sp.]